MGETLLRRSERLCFSERRFPLMETPTRVKRPVPLTSALEPEVAPTAQEGGTLKPPILVGAYFCDRGLEFRVKVRQA